MCVFLSVCPESESKPECDLVDEILETGWTYVPQEDEKRGLALAKDLKEFTSYYYERILTNNTQLSFVISIIKEFSLNTRDTFWYALTPIGSMSG